MAGVGGGGASAPAEGGEGDKRLPKITDIYDRIFSADPLLIDEDSRRQYSAALLKHLLITRAISATRNEEIDLRIGHIRQEFLSRSTGPFPPLDRIAVDAYAERRRDRAEVERPLFDALKNHTIVSNGLRTADRKLRSQNPAGSDGAGKKRYASHQDALDELPVETAPSSIGNRLRIATIGYRVTVSLDPNRAHCDEELATLDEPKQAFIQGLPEPSRIAELGRTRLIGDRDRWERKIKRYIKHALSRQPHLVVLPEFALPPRDGSGLQEPGPDLEESLSPYHAGLKEICHCDGGDHFMFAGSRHEGPYNRGLVLSKVGTHMCAGWWHYKNAPAKGMGENILARHGRKAPTYMMTTKIADLDVTLAIMVAICYDAFDPTTFLNLILQSRQTSQEVISVILVPSFNISDDFVALLRDLSFLARCVVVYVNGLHGDARVYAYGVAITDIADHFAVIKEKVESEYDAVVKKIAADVKRVTEAPSKNEQAKQDELFPAWQAMRTALKAFRTDLNDWEESRACEHMITIERGQPPLDPVEGYAADDILYYNIDVAMLGGLAQFRNAFFFQDKFLPDAFHESTITEALEQLRLRARIGR